MLIETLTVNSLPSRRKHYNNIHCSIWEEKTCEKQHEWQRWQSSKHGLVRGAVQLRPCRWSPSHQPCSQPRCLCPNYICPKQHPWAEQGKLKILKPHKKESTFFTKGSPLSVALLYCSIILRSGPHNAYTWGTQPFSAVYPLLRGSYSVASIAACLCCFGWSRADICAKQRPGSLSLTELPVRVSHHPDITLSGLCSLRSSVITARPSSTRSVPLWSSDATPTSPDRQV